jgi:hypothetical protein
MEEADLSQIMELQVATVSALMSMKENASSPERKNAAQPLHHPAQHELLPRAKT